MDTGNHVCCTRCRGRTRSSPFKKYDGIVTVRTCPFCKLQFLRCDQCEEQNVLKQKQTSFGPLRIASFPLSKPGFKQLSQHVRRYHSIGKQLAPSRGTRSQDCPSLTPTTSPEMETMMDYEFSMSPNTNENVSSTISNPMQFIPQELEPMDFDNFFESTFSHPSHQAKTPPTTRVDVTSGFQNLLRYNDFDYRDSIAQLVYCACTRQKNISASMVAQEMDGPTAELFIHTACMAEVTPAGNLHNLARIGQMTYPRKSKVPIPTSEKEIQQQILSTRGKTSFQNLLPIPKIESLRCGHSYISLVELIGYASMIATEKDYRTVRDRHLSLLKSSRFLAFKSKVEKILRDKNSNNAGNKNTSSSVIVITLFWSDGFEPNRTLDNRGSVWAMTVTLLFYDCGLETIYMVRTVLLSVGVDKSDHTPVFERLRTELENICEPREGAPKSSCSFPSHFHKKKEKGVGDTDFYILPFGCVMDNPERRSNFWLLSHSSKAHTLFARNCRYDLLKKKFECNHDECKCTDTMKEYLNNRKFDKQAEFHCDHCLSFSLRRLDEEGEYETPLFQREGEKEKIPGEELFTAPGELSCSLLIDGWNYAFSRFTQGDWTQNRSTEYLHDVLCLNEFAIQRFVSQAKEKIEHNQWKDNDPCLDPESAERVRMNVETNPGYYQDLGKHNPLWDLCELEYAFETIMHNCMNTGRHVFKALLDWASGLKLKTDLVDHMQDRLRPVQYAKVEDFKARTFTGDAQGGYVAENHRAFLVLSPWILSSLNDKTFQKKSPGEAPPDNLPMKDWTRDHLKHYLHINRVRKCQIRQYEIRGTGAQSPKEKPKISFKGIGSMNKSELIVATTKVSDLLDRIERGTVRSIVNADIEYVPVTAANTSRSSKKRVEIRPFFASKDWLQGQQMFSMFPEISEYFTVLMDTSLTGEPAKNRAEVHAMLFMSRMLNVLSHITEDDPLKDFRGKSCLYGILRSTTHLSTIPWLKSIHEGGDMGEGIVRSLRKGVTHGLRQGWQNSLMTSFYKRHSMSFICEFFKGEGVPPEDDEGLVMSSAIDDEETMFGFENDSQPTLYTKTPDQNRRFRRYGSINVFEEKMKKQNVLSLVMYSSLGKNEDMVGVVVSESGKWIVHFIDFDEKSKPPKRIGTLWYFKIAGLLSRNETIKCRRSMSLPQNCGLRFNGFCVALPRLQAGKNTYRYTIICGDGRKYNKQRVFESSKFGDVST